MSLIGKSIYTLLSAESDITDLVSTRIYPVRVAQNGSYPAIVYSILGAVPTNDKTGTTNRRSQIDDFEVQISVHAKDYATTQDVCKAVRDTIDKYSGTSAGVSINSIYWDEQSDRYDDDIKLHNSFQRYYFRINN